MYVYLVSFLFSYKTVTTFSCKYCRFSSQLLFYPPSPSLFFCIQNADLKDLFYDEKMGYFQYAKEMTVSAFVLPLTSSIFVLLVFDTVI